MDELQLAPRHSFPLLITYVDESIDDTELWQHLHRAFFGSEAVFVEYVEKVWDLFEYIESNGDKPIYIVKDLRFDQQMLESIRNLALGIALSPELVNAFIEERRAPE